MKIGDRPVLQAFQNLIPPKIVYVIHLKLSFVFMLLGQTTSTTQMAGGLVRSNGGEWRISPSLP